MKKIIFILTFILTANIAVAKNTVTGFWTTIDDETNTPKSVVQIYEYNGKIYGRVVELFKNKEARAKIKGNPKIKGLDILWDLQKNGRKYTDGEILDPVKGKVYGCELWRDGQNLIVRGKIAFLGRNQTWIPNADFNNQATQDTEIKPKKPNL